jgi:excisionase family DNA binding protein
MDTTNAGTNRYTCRVELTLAQAAARYGQPRRTLQAAVTRGHLVARRLGWLWVVRDSAVERWLREGKHRPGPPPAPPGMGRRRRGQPGAARAP